MAHVFQVAAGVPASWPWKAQQTHLKTKLFVQPSEASGLQP